MTRELDDHVTLDLSTLDSAECGKEFSRTDLIFLGVLGIVVPAVLLAWGLAL